MALILHHPHPFLPVPEERPDLTYYDTHPSLSRKQLKAFMRKNQIVHAPSSSDEEGTTPPQSSISQGESPTVSSTVKRRPFIGEMVAVESPEDSNVIFQIKRCGVRENIARQNLSSTVRYVSRDDEYATERDFPVGDMQLKTIQLGLGGWNLTDDNDRPLPVSEETISNYLSPDEFSFLYNKVLEINPMWGSGGESSTKKS